MSPETYNWDVPALDDRKFDRLVSTDPGMSRFRIRSIVADTRPFRSNSWAAGDRVLDQGTEGACVGFGFAHELAARSYAPSSVGGVTNEVARLLYVRARQRDEYPGEDYDGTSVNGGALVVRDAGFARAFHWADTFDDIRRAVGYEGPVVMGTNWHESMWDTNSIGYFPAGVSGDVVGGHCWLIRGVSERRREFLCRNSWGVDWGVFGEFRMSFADVRRLFDEDGEACLLVGRDPIGSLAF